MRDAEHVTDTLDREIAEALAIDPSPDFHARIRQRVTIERRAPAWPLTALGIAAAFVVAAAAVVVWRSQREPATLGGRTIPVRATMPRGDSGKAAVETSTPPRDVRAPRPADVVARRSTEPEILVDWREARATRALIDGVVSGDISLAPLLTASSPAFLAIEPIPESEFITNNPQPQPGGRIETGVAQ